jgi:hypothetical protein
MKYVLSHGSANIERCACALEMLDVSWNMRGRGWWSYPMRRRPAACAWAKSVNRCCGGGLDLFDAVVDAADLV